MNTLFEAKIKAKERSDAGYNCGKGYISLCFHDGLYFICSAVHARVNFYKVIRVYNFTY